VPPAQRDRAAAGRSWTQRLFPRGVRVRHFILVPSIGMGLVLALSRLADRLVAPSLGTVGNEFYTALRTTVVSLLMASLIAWLAVRYRSDYEAKLQARNEALEATRDFLSRIIESSAEAIITLDTAGRVRSWNRAAETIYGWTAQEMLGQTIERLFPPAAHAEEEIRHIEDLARAGQTVRLDEARRLRKDGRPITVQITRSALHDAAGNHIGSTGIVRDVSRLKEMEARLLEQERLAAVGELAAMVAHEVRNPLAGIRGACEILLEGYGDSDPRREIGEEVIRQVDRLNRDVEDLLLYARPRTMDPVPTELHGVLDRALRTIADDPATAQVGVRRDYDPALPVLRVDPRQMEQVFLNILLNACQAMDHRGEVRIRTRRDGRQVQIEIRDSGPGIPPEALERIFRPFFTTRTRGTGLGLAIVKNIVEAHGGGIRAGSPAGGGAEFVLTLPVPEDTAA
jgi:two-component system nitrogen regulation sensor histidine kinase GlnL